MTKKFNFCLKALGGLALVVSLHACSGENATTVPPSSSPLSKSEQFLQELNKQVEGNPNNGYALDVIEGWNNSLTSTGREREAAYKIACEEVNEKDFDPSSAAQEAYEVNNHHHRLEEYQVYYSAKANAVKKVGCN